MNLFEARLAAALEQPQKDKIYLAAVSGGADSTAMLAGLEALRKEAGFTLHCIHVEHGLRSEAESRGDAQAVEALCKLLNVPCRIISIPPGKIAAFASKGGPGIQAAARYFRRKIWNRERRRVKAGKILTAHTFDDLMETLLMRILRGSGPAGLAPMPRNKGRLLRPLLDLRRQDVLDYLKNRGIPHRTDASNADLRYLRSRVRYKLIPVLNDFFPSWQLSLLALAETQSLTADFLRSESLKRLSWENFSEEKLILKEEVFLKAPQILREEAVFAGADLLADLRCKTRRAVPRRASVRRAVKQLSLGQGTANDLGPVRLEKKGGNISLERSKKFRGERGFSLLIKGAGLYTLEGKLWGKKKDMRIRVDALPANANFVGNNAGFNAQLPLVFRNHEKADLLLKGGHKRRFSDILDIKERSAYAAIITVLDSEGPLAFIAVGKSLCVISKDETAFPKAEGLEKPLIDLFFIEVFEGMDV